MPIVHFLGVEAEVNVRRKIMQRIKVWVASVEGLDVSTEYVTAFFISSEQENRGDKVVFYVQELFEVSAKGSPRTDKLREALCKAIEKGFYKEFVVTDRLFIRPTGITVVIRRIDRDKGEYHYRNIYSV